MATIIKKRPATINGRECNELLVLDFEIGNTPACNLCCYRDWSDYNQTMSLCKDVHGCTCSPFTYFLTEKR